MTVFRGESHMIVLPLEKEDIMFALLNEKCEIVWPALLKLPEIGGGLYSPQNITIIRS